jgi:hypothetical protein
MLRGRLDSVTSTGYVVGWAYDTEKPFWPLEVAVMADDAREVAWGLAHGYRDDLVEGGCATGWCEFRLKLDPWPVVAPWRALSVVERATGRAIVRKEMLPFVMSEEKFIDTIDALLATDPTMIQSLQQLRGCEELFQTYIAAHGVDAFVRSAYVYLLSRPADDSGLAAYRNHLRAKKVTAYKLLLAIADSDEYRLRPRQHCAPTVGAFPFRVD